jgi:hypothetical protein
MGGWDIIDQAPMARHVVTTPEELGSGTGGAFRPAGSTAPPQPICPFRWRQTLRGSQVFSTFHMNKAGAMMMPFRFLR